MHHETRALTELCHAIPRIELLRSGCPRVHVRGVSLIATNKIVCVIIAGSIIPVVLIRAIIEVLLVAWCGN